MILYFKDPDKGKYKDLKIHHSLDMWHGAKNFCKKIATVSSNTSNFIYKDLYLPACRCNNFVMLGLHQNIYKD